MCVGPGAFTLPVIIGLLSGAVSTAGTVVGAVATQRSAEANQAVNEANATIAKRNAEDARQRGIAAEQDVQMRTRAMIGKQTNILSERNINVGEGSPLDIIGDTAALGKLDALTTRQNFQREAISYEAQSMNFTAAAEQDSMRARSALFEGVLGGFSTALGAAGDITKLRTPRSVTL